MLNGEKKTNTIIIPYSKKVEHPEQSGIQLPHTTPICLLRFLASTLFCPAQLPTPNSPPQHSLDKMVLPTTHQSKHQIAGLNSLPDSPALAQMGWNVPSARNVLSALATLSLFSLWKSYFSIKHNLKRTSLKNSPNGN